MDSEVALDIEAPADVVWRVLANVERWPEWTASMRSVELLDPGPLRLGSRVRVRQPRLPVAVWEVTELEPGTAFAWTSKVPGLTSYGIHRVAPRGDGASTVTLGIEWRGVAAPLVRLLWGGMTKRYVRMEAEGLRTRSIAEAGPPAG